MPTSSQVQRRIMSQVLCSTHKCCRDPECTGRKSHSNSNLSKNPDQRCSYVFFLLGVVHFLALGSIYYYKQVLDSMMHWNKMKQLVQKASQLFIFMSFFDMHHLLPNSEFYQLRMSTSIAGFFTLSYIKITRKADFICIPTHV